MLCPDHVVSRPDQIMWCQSKRGLCCVKLKRGLCCVRTKGILLCQTKRRLCCVKPKGGYVVSEQQWFYYVRVKGFILCQGNRVYVVSGQKGFCCVRPKGIYVVSAKLVLLCQGKRIYVVSGQEVFMLCQGKRGRGLCCVRARVGGDYVVSGQDGGGGIRLGRGKRGLCCIRLKVVLVVLDQKGRLLCQTKMGLYYISTKGAVVSG